MLSSLLKAGDVVVCKYFSVINPNKRWIVWDVDLKNQMIIFRTVVDERTWSSREMHMYEVDALIEKGDMKVIPEEIIF